MTPVIMVYDVSIRRILRVGTLSLDPNKGVYANGKKWFGGVSASIWIPPVREIFEEICK